MNLKSFIYSSVLLASGLTASAATELIDGGVYRITNVYNSLVMTAPASTGNIKIQELNPDDSHQLWQAVINSDGSGYYFREITHGTYMTSPIVKSGAWVTTFTTEPDENKMSFIINEAANYVTIQALGHSLDSSLEYQAGYAHGNGSAGTNVTCWGGGADASHWTVNRVDMDEATLQSYKNNWYPISIKPNRVYQFVNSVKNTAFHASESSNNVDCITPDQTDKSQLWLTEPTADGTGYYLRNLVTGKYLNSPLKVSTYWTCNTYPGTGCAVFNITPVSESSALFHILPQGVDASTQNYAHCDGSNKLVSWGSAHNQSKWNINLIESYDDAAIAAEKANWANPTIPTIEPNKVYSIVNANYSHALTQPSGTKSIIGSAINTSDETQLWITEQAADGSGMILRNYSSGGALQSSMAISEPWSAVSTTTPDPDKTVMTLTMVPEGFFTIKPIGAEDLTGNNKSHCYAHEAGGTKVVCWEPSNLPSQWSFNLMQDYTEEMISAQRQSWPFALTEGISGLLNQLFADKTCTVLNSEYAEMTAEEIQQSAPYLALPQTLQQMVMKVHSGDWSETDPQNSDISWDSEHAKKFRVQMIEPYSECGTAAGLTCIYAYTNLNNVTGILGDNGSTLYVMVDKGAADGSTLYIAPRTFADNVDKLNYYNDGTELHEGLNIIPCNEDCAQMVIYYTIKTSQGRTRQYDLTNYDDIKVHIEGGSINGFFNSVGDELYTADTNEDWFYYRDRARHPRFCLISEHCILYLHFDDAADADGHNFHGLKNLLTPAEYTAGNFDLNATMNAWDDMFVAEMLVMGLMNDDVIRAEKEAGRDWYDPLEGDDVAPSDYWKYFNNRLMGISTTSGFMSATWFRTTYHINTLRSIIMDFPTMDLWGPAHEFGHMNQGPMNIAGCTEESNNVFSNIALFYRGDKTSRASLPSVHRDFFNKGYNFHQHDTWGTTRMWFQLWLYYHATGHNKKFYPRLYELLRNNPLRKSSTQHLNAKDDLLHFAKMCCIAAGEDLTDFFDSWGFLVPQDGYFIGDYTSYTSYLSQEEIDEWRADIAQLAEENGWERNTAIIFIDDRVGSTKPGYAGWCEPANAGSMGALSDYQPGAEAVSGDYEFVLTGTTVTIKGAAGGVGFIIYDENGKLIGFSNETTFEVSPEAAEQIASGNITLNVVTGENEEIEVTDLMRDGSEESKTEVIATLLERAEAVIAKADFTKRKVGFIKPELVADLNNFTDSVKTVIDNGELSADNILHIYSRLNNEVVAGESIALTAETTIGIQPEGIYVFVHNKLYGDHGIRPAADGNTIEAINAANTNKPNQTIDLDDQTQQWLFIPVAERSSLGGFYIQSISTGKYMKIPNANETPVLLSDEPQKFIVEIKAPGLVSVAGDIDGSAKALHAAGDKRRIVRWTTDAEASQWTLQLIDNADKQAALFALNHMIELSETLLAQAGTIEVTTDDEEQTVVAAFPSEQFSLVEPEMMLNLYSELQIAKAILANEESTNDQLYAEAEQLQELYSILLAAMNRNSERLRELIDQTRSLAAELGTNSEEITPLPLTTDHYSTNAEYTGVNSGDHLSSWSVLFDNQPNTYFHSNYDGNTTDGLDHYIQIQLPEPTQIDETHLVLTYTTRNHTSNTYAPSTAIIQYSADGESWTTAQELDAVLPYTHNTQFESETFTVPAETAYVRFTVSESRRSATNADSKGISNGHYYFAVSEFGLSTYNAGSVPNTQSYPDSNAEDITAALRQARNSEIVLNAANTAHQHYDQSYAALLPHYQTLLAIKNNPAESVGINELKADEANATVIYNLRGQRLNRISAPGLYIINGVKVRIK